jgi:hypothetical protein
MNLDGLHIIAKNGITWRWVGSDLVRNKHGQDVQVERLARPCRFCGSEFSVLQRLPRKFRLQYLAAMARGERTCTVRVPADRRIAGLELVNCPEHRGYGAPLI